MEGEDVSSNNMRDAMASLNGRKKIPAFKDEDAEREFWSREDSTEYIDWSKAQRLTLPNLKPSMRTIPLRLPPD
jgi:hypothetical protein